uniref:AIG1-type G domain-containing protein n=1 Tax=Phasianus colchicus TaxID=9054 RepID=A0A669R2S3_PHACC
GSTARGGRPWGGAGAPGRRLAPRRSPQSPSRRRCRRAAGRRRAAGAAAAARREERRREERDGQRRPGAGGLRVAAVHARGDAEERRQSGSWRGYGVHVVAAPDAFDSPERGARCRREIARCALLSAPGPHALLLVTQPGRFTQEDEAAVRQVWRLFGRGAAERTVVVFTRGDEPRGGSLRRHVEDTGTAALRELLRDCGGRCCAFDNRGGRPGGGGGVGRGAAGDRAPRAGGDLSAHYRNELYDRAARLLELPDVDFEKKCDLPAEDAERRLQGRWHTRLLERLRFIPAVQWLRGTRCARCVCFCCRCVLAALLALGRALRRVLSWGWQSVIRLYHRFVR